VKNLSTSQELKIKRLELNMVDDPIVI